MYFLDKIVFFHYILFILEPPLFPCELHVYLCISVWSFGIFKMLDYMYHVNSVSLHNHLCGACDHMIWVLFITPVICFRNRDMIQWSIYKMCFSLFQEMFKQIPKGFTFFSFYLFRKVLLREPCLFLFVFCLDAVITLKHMMGAQYNQLAC